MAVGDELAGEIRTLQCSPRYIICHNTHRTLQQDIGLYRLDDDSWQRLRFPVPEAERIEALAGTEDTLYVMARLGWDKIDVNVQRANGSRTETVVVDFPINR